jgi:hypothetical protein
MTPDTPSQPADTSEDSPRPPGIQVIDRAAALLDAIARYPEPVSLKILAAETGLNVSTAHRILASLIQNQFVEKDAASHYRLGRRLLQLGVRLHGNIDVRALARPVIERCATASARPSISPSARVILWSISRRPRPTA